jgi:hypothetical protein
MGFVNEKLTKEERAAFVARGIKNPVPPVLYTLGTTYWTIDHEKDMCLVQAGEQREYWEEQYFVFLWKGEQHAISLVAETASPNTIIWKKEIQASKYTFSVRDPFVTDFREALKVFKFRGVPEEMGSDSTVIIRF